MRGNELTRIAGQWRRLRREYRDWGAPAFAGYATVAFVVLALLAFFFLPEILVGGRSFKTDADEVKAVNDARGSVLQLLGGIALLVGAYFTARTLRLNRASHVSERFSRAMEQLGAQKQAVQAGAIYALEAVMRDAPDEQGAVIETLVAFLRDTRPLPAGGAHVDPGPAKPPAVAPAAAIRVIGRRAVQHDPESRGRYGWNLTELDLRDFSLRHGDYTGVNFWRSDLRRANLVGADLREAKGLDAALLADAVCGKGTRLPTTLDTSAIGLRYSEAPDTPE